MGGCWAAAGCMKVRLESEASPGPGLRLGSTSVSIHEGWVMHYYSARVFPSFACFFAFIQIIFLLCLVVGRGKAVGSESYYYVVTFPPLQGDLSIYHISLWIVPDPVRLPRPVVVAGRRRRDDGFSKSAKQ